jgi:uncharacterized iron-regulated membrane protein
MSLFLDWWQLGWLLAGFFLVMFFALGIATWGQSKKALAIGNEQGWHERQHWETDQVVKGKLERP